VGHCHYSDTVTQRRTAVHVCTDVDFVSEASTEWIGGRRKEGADVTHAADLELLRLALYHLSVSITHTHTHTHQHQQHRQTATAPTTTRKTNVHQNNCPRLKQKWNPRNETNAKKFFLNKMNSMLKMSLKVQQLKANCSFHIGRKRTFQVYTDSTII